MKLIHSELQPFSAIPALLTQLISGQYGQRPWVAISAVLNRGRGEGAAWVVNSAGCQELPLDQRNLVRKTIGMEPEPGDWG